MCVRVKIGTRNLPLSGVFNSSAFLYATESALMQDGLWLQETREQALEHHLYIHLTEMWINSIHSGNRLA